MTSVRVCVWTVCVDCVCSGDYGKKKKTDWVLIRGHGLSHACPSNHVRNMPVMLPEGKENLLARGIPRLGGLHADVECLLVDVVMKQDISVVKNTIPSRFDS